MFDRRLLVLAISLGTVAGGIRPAPATAAPVDHAVFAASEIDVDHPSGALEGTLDVSIFPNGNVMGYFRTADSSRFIQVSGALNGSHMFLDIGRERPIVGTFDGTKFVGYRDFGLDQYRFTAIRSNQPPT